MKYTLETYLRGISAMPAMASAASLVELKLFGIDSKPYSPEYFWYPVGIEIEVEGYKEDNVLRPHKLWQFKQDGSLRNGGLEAYSRPLHTAEQVGLALDEFKQCFLKKVPGYDFSWRTGIHVHICPLSFTMKDIVNCFLTFAMIEPLLFKVFAEHRKNSIFCVPLMDSDECIEFVQSLIRDVEADKDYNWISIVCANWPQNKKYASINFFRMKDIGTIEFRHLMGIDDLVLLKDWISVINLILNFAEKTSFEELKQKIIEINTSSQYFDFVEKIFKNLSGKFLVPEFEKYLEEGAKKAKTFFTKKKVSLKVGKVSGLLDYGKKILDKKRERRKKYY